QTICISRRLASADAASGRLAARGAPPHRARSTSDAVYSLQPGRKAAHHTANSASNAQTRGGAVLSLGIVSFVAFPLVILAAIFPGAILVDRIEYDAGDALMR